MRFFNECQTIDEVKRVYKQLALQHHPDRGGDLETMQQVNNEYAFACARLYHAEDLTAEEFNEKIAVSEVYQEAIEAIIAIPGITVELVGHWIWVTGNTYPHRQQLLEAAYRFSGKNKAWYFRTGEFACRRKSNLSLDEIRNKYGSETVNGKKGNFLTSN